MSSFPSSNRYPPLGEQDEVRLEMEELSQAQQATGPGWQDSIREALTVALSASLLPPAKLETKPPLRRRSWPILAAEDRMNELSERRDDMQKTKAASLPELREKASPDESKVESRKTAGSSADPMAVESLAKPKIWNKGHPVVYPHEHLNEPPKDGSWETLKRGIDKYDDELCRAWNGELDTILTFTGLFSAAVTAFCIESFQALSQSSADTTNVFLLAISQQLANPSAPTASMSMVEGFAPNVYDVRINVLYFISLALALSVSSVCILGKQWIREYQKDASVSPCDAVRIRQARFDSLEAWKVPQIMVALPVLLLIALMLFFSGLLIQLWSISDHMTATAVTLVVSLTAILVIVTTVVPGYVSMQSNRLSFAPFRSPQAWAFFVLYRQLRHWFSRDWWAQKYHPILSSWAAFDLHFVRSETEDRFDHDVSSVHRALRWVVEVLRNSSEMEKSLFWCLQPNLYPQDLIESEGFLCDYVLLGSDENDGFNNPDHAYHDYSCGNEGEHRIDNTIGRRQAELLMRSAHRACDYASSNPQRRWDYIDHACFGLQLRDIFDEYSGQDTVHQQHILHDQVALLYERIFTSSIPPPSPSFNWLHIIRLVLEARCDSSNSSLLSRQILHDVIGQHIPTWIKTHNSPSLLHDIGEKVCFWADEFPEHAIELFTHLDKIMVEFCSSPEGVEWLSEEINESWRDLRTQLIETARNQQVADQFRLSDQYFDNVPGHRFLLPSPLSGHTEIEMAVRQPGPASTGSASGANDDR